MSFLFSICFGTLPVVFSGSSDAGSLTNLLKSATEMLTWYITSMGSLVTFILSNPLILTMFFILLSGSVIGMFMRIWHSV